MAKKKKKAPSPAKKNQAVQTPPQPIREKGGLSFFKVFVIWFIIDLIALSVISLTVKSSLLASLANASIGIFLLIKPVYPQAFLHFNTPEQAEKTIRIIALVQILIAFLAPVKF